MLAVRRLIAVGLGVVALGLVAISVALMAASVVYDFRWTTMLFGWRWSLPLGLGDPSMSETFWTGLIITFVCMMPGGVASLLAEHVIGPLWERRESLPADAVTETY